MPTTTSNTFRRPSPIYPLLELAANQPAALNGRGASYLESGKSTKLSGSQPGTRTESRLCSRAANRSRLYLDRKQYSEAIADCDAALRMNPSTTWAVERKQQAGNRAAGVTVNVSAPNLLSPAPGTVFGHYPRDTMLVWSGVPGHESYVVEWDYKGADSWAADQRSTQGALIKTSQPVANFKFIGAQPGRWRVWAIDAAGQPGPKSDCREFLYTH